MLSDNQKTYCTDDKLLSYFGEYNKKKTHLEVDFRETVNWLSYPERATHQIHPYPGKLLMHIPHFFLANSVLSKQGDTVLDPFCGTGTVQLESLLTGRNSIGVDSNPLARLISRVKTTQLCTNKIKEYSEALRNKIPDKPKNKPPDVVNLKYWFFPRVIKQLLSIYEAIETIENQYIREFYLVCFSKCVRQVSLADPKISVPVKLRIDGYPEGYNKLKEKNKKHINHLKKVNVSEEFFKIVNANIERMENMIGLLNNNYSSEIICSDSRDLKHEFSSNSKKNKKLADESVQLVITSPPYAGAQKYIRSSSLNLGWLGFCKSDELKQYENQTIGREHFPKKECLNPIRVGIKSADIILERVFKEKPLRAHIAGKYLLEMKETFKETVRVLKSGGHIVLVIGNNYVCGNEFNTQEYLRIILEELGLKTILKLTDHIRSRGLMTKRNKTASIITKEWVLVFRKN